MAAGAGEKVGAPPAGGGGKASGSSASTGGGASSSPSAPADAAPIGERDYMDLESWDLEGDFASMEAWLGLAGGNLKKRRKYLARHILATPFAWHSWLQYKVEHDDEDGFWSGVKSAKLKGWAASRQAYIDNTGDDELDSWERA